MKLLFPILLFFVPTSCVSPDPPAPAAASVVRYADGFLEWRDPDHLVRVRLHHGQPISAEDAALFPQELAESVGVIFTR